MSLLTRLLLTSTILVVVALLAFSASVYADLPARIPTHFDAAGIPDGFGARSNWWILPTISVASATLLIGVALLLPRRPDLLNLPSKREILALPRAAQIAVVRQAQPGLLMLGLMTAGVFLFLQYATWEATQGRSATGMGSLVLILPIGSIALLPALLVPVRRELRRQQAAHSGVTQPR
jgi:uncharacterized membrane protein